MTAPTPIQFSETLLKELKAFGLPELPASSNARDHAYESNLVGLSFSGGGIRSATFNLGIIQALAQVELLSRFHYLSTVSGGGYVGSWLSALTNRRMDGDIRRTEQAIAEASGLVRPKVLLNSARADTQCAANAIYFLRQFSNYLIPHKRLLSGDSLAALGTYMRNVLINQIILIALFSAAMTLPYFLAWIGHASIGHSYEATFVAGITFSIASSIIGFCVWAQPGLQRHKPSIWWKWQGRLTGVALFLLFFGIFLFTVAVFDIEETKIGPLPVKFLDPLLSPTEQSIAVLFCGFYTGGWLLGNAFALLWKRLRHKEEFAASQKGIIWQNSLIVVVIAAGASLLIGVVLAELVPLGLKVSRMPGYAPLVPWLICGVAFPIVAMIFWFTLTLQTALASRLFREMRREWWARTSGILVCTVALWSLACAVTVLSAPLIAWGYWSLINGGAVWILTTIGGLVLGKSGITKAIDGKGVLDSVILIAPPVFILGFAIFISWLVHGVLSAGDISGGSNLFMEFVIAKTIETQSIVTESLWPAILALVVFASAGLFLGRRASINLFSLSNFYGNRLTRCYVGASTPDRHANSFTGFSTEDKFLFARLARDANGNEKLTRPLHIVNTALNLVSGRELAWQERKAAPFSFTPFYAGFALPPTADRTVTEAYVPTEAYMETGGPSMGHLLAMSGAAASPNMGYHSSPAISFLLTLFNVRLGRWCPNPATADKTNLLRPDPVHGWQYLFREVFGLTDESTDYVYLSDGGHFENLGLYELVRRRCKVIMVCDAGCDPGYTFEDLGNAIRKCRIDLGVEIEIDLESIKPSSLVPNSLSKRYFAYGKITYPGGKQACLVYVKASLTGHEPADVKQFKSLHSDFPHHATSDQFFDESTFESYRHLGLTIGIEVANECGDLIRHPERALTGCTVTI